MINRCLDRHYICSLIAILTLIPNFGFAQSDSNIAKALSTKVVLAGEMHFYTPFETYDYLFKNFAKHSSARACLAVEFPKTQKTLSEFLDDLEGRSNLIKKDSHPMAFEISKSLDMAVFFYRNIDKIAKSYGLKVMLVEHPDKMNLDLDIDQRNKSIAENINSLLVSNSCSRILGIFGKAHLSHGMMRTTTIKELLAEVGTVSSSINLQMTNETGLEQSYQSFKLSGLVAKPSKFIILKNSDLGNDIALFPNIPGEGSTYQNFDFTLLIPSNLKPLVYN